MMPCAMERKRTERMRNDNQDVIETLVKLGDHQSPDDDDMQFIKRIGELTNTSVRNIKINEQAIGGELVVQLPTLGVESE